MKMAVGHSVHIRYAFSIPNPYFRCISTAKELRRVCKRPAKAGAWICKCAGLLSRGPRDFV